METSNQLEKDSFYQAAYSLEEVANLLNLAMDDSLDEEIAAVRVATRRTLLKMEKDLETADFVKMVNLIHKGASTVALLLRTRRAISDKAAEGIMEGMIQIIQELGTENDWITQ